MDYERALIKLNKSLKDNGDYDFEEASVSGNRPCKSSKVTQIRKV